jgi:site-specific DNA recombinase
MTNWRKGDNNRLLSAMSGIFLTQAFQHMVWFGNFATERHAILSLAEYQRRRHELEQQKQALATQAQQLDAHVDRRAEVTGLLTSIEAFCQRAREGLATATFAQKRTLVELLIDRVLVTNGEVEIRYVFPTHPRSEKTRYCHLRKDYFLKLPI